MGSNPVVVRYRGSAAMLSAHGAIYVVTIQPHPGSVQKFPRVEGVFWFYSASYVKVEVHSHPEGFSGIVSVGFMWRD